MPTDDAPPSSREAREQLSSARTALTDPRDRRIHAIKTAAIGAAVGAVMGLQNVLVGSAGTALRAVIYFAVIGAALIWAEQAARTVPRHAKLASRVGLGASFAVGLTLVMPWLNLSAQDQPNTLGMAALAAALIALPSCAAAGYIAARR